MREFIIACAFAAMATPAVAEVQSCVNYNVTKVLREGTIDSMKERAGKFLKAAPGPNTPILLQELSQWDAKIQNIRQTGYDSDSDVRYCVADFINNPRPAVDLALMLMVSGVHDTTCAHVIHYKIEALLDKDGEFEVSWQCE